MLLQTKDQKKKQEGGKELFFLREFTKKQKCPDTDGREFKKAVSYCRSGQSFFFIGLPALTRPVKRCENGTSPRTPENGTVARGNARGYVFTLPKPVKARNGAVSGSEGYVSLRVRVEPDFDPRISRRLGSGGDFSFIGTCKKAAKLKHRREPPKKAP